MIPRAKIEPLANGGRHRTPAAVLLVLVGLCVSAGFVHAHPMAPSLLELREDDGRVLVLWKISLLNTQAASLAPVLPSSCSRTSSGWDDAPAAERQDTGLIRRWTAECGSEGLVERRIEVRGLDRVDTNVLLRVALADGRTAQAILRPDEPFFVVPRKPTSLTVAGSYLSLGFGHILSGFDHLLFVLGLLFLVRGRRALLWTVTAFTLGHSVTLSLAALGLVRLAAPPVELAIAFSIWILALELTRDRNQPPSCLSRCPWRMAAVFGLLHGLGFAGALAEAGLPEGDVPLALLSFNTGIEIGQLAFILAVLASRVVFEFCCNAIRGSGEPCRLEQYLSMPAAYLIGVLSTYWCLQRGDDLVTMLSLNTSGLL